MADRGAQGAFDSGRVEELELELYILRSDYQRAVNRADQLHSELIKLKRELHERPRDRIDTDLLRSDHERLWQELMETREALKKTQNELSALTALRDHRTGQVGECIREAEAADDTSVTATR